MTIRVTASDLSDLLSFLRAAGCIAYRAGTETIEAQIPEALSERNERLELGAYLASWRATHPDAVAELLADA